MLDGLMQGVDRNLVNIWQKMNNKLYRTETSTRISFLRRNGSVQGGL